MELIKLLSLCILCLVSLLANSRTAHAQVEKGKNLLANPSFDMLSPIGDSFPLSWTHQVVGDEASVSVDKDAVDGGLSVRMKAAGNSVAVVNSETVPISSGTLSFKYKLIASGNKAQNMTVYVIAMNAESVDIGRVGTQMPEQCIGDGQWHEMTLNFSFNASQCVKVLVAPRINEAGERTVGEWLLDDFSVMVKKLGAKPMIEALYQPKPVLLLGKKSQLVVQIANQGDEEILGSRLLLNLPEGLTLSGDFQKLTPTQYAVDVLKLAPADSIRYELELLANKLGEYDLNLEWQTPSGSVTRSRHTVCVSKLNERELYTGSDGYWRAMPPITTLQQGNSSSLSQVKRKKSVDLPDSYFGMTAHLPRSVDFERVFESGFLIDGDQDTNWAGRAHATQVPGSVEWVEIKLPKPQPIAAIHIVPYWHGEGFPLDFVIKLRSGGKWVDVYQGKNATIPASDGTPGQKKPYVIQLAKLYQADAVRLEVTRFGMVSGFFCDLGASNGLRLSGIEAIDPSGQNLALSSKGATVTASTTHKAYFNTAKTVRETYPQMYELGMKWNRVGQWGDYTAWAMVEQQKGVYKIDPETDQAVTDSIKNGVNILYTLDYGNPLYEKTRWLSDQGPVWRHGHPFTGDGGPTKAESIQGFVNYAKFVATHFKGRITHYEIWNEENSWAWYGEPPSPEHFGTLIRETSKALKQIDPNIKIMVGGTAAYSPQFTSDTIDVAGRENIDAVGFHPYGAPYAEKAMASLDVVNGVQQGKPPSEYGCDSIEQLLAFFRTKYGKGNPDLKIWQNEWNACPFREDDVYPTNMSEVMEAKQIARYYISGLMNDMPSVWWSLYNENYISDWGILREADQSRKPAFFTTQVITTYLSGAKPDPSIVVTASPMLPELRCNPVRGYQGELMLIVWQATSPNNEFEGKPITLRVKLSGVKSVEGISTLRAMVQKLNFRQDGEELVIEGLLASDAPVIVRIR